MTKQKGNPTAVEPTRKKAQKRQEVRLSGFGGQGIVLAGNILGKAVVLHEGRNAVFTQSYGPEARGGACSADVVLSGEIIHYPKVSSPDVLVFMSEEAKNTYGKQIEKGTTVIYDEDLVQAGDLDKQVPRVFSVPATRFAEELGRKMVANIVMLGFLAAVTDVVKHDSLKKAVLSSVPKGTEALNTSAFERGYEYGQEKRGG
jgi:2-oxoglutarate ferredoxin oxidoreductase subunit gamma